MYIYIYINKFIVLHYIHTHALFCDIHLQVELSWLMGLQHTALVVASYPQLEVWYCYRHVVLRMHPCRVPPPVRTWDMSIIVSSHKMMQKHMTLECSLAIISKGFEALNQHIFVSPNALETQRSSLHTWSMWVMLHLRFTDGNCMVPMAPGFSGSIPDIPSSRVRTRWGQRMDTRIPGSCFESNLIHRSSSLRASWRSLEPVAQWPFWCQDANTLKVITVYHYIMHVNTVVKCLMYPYFHWVNG